MKTHELRRVDGCDGCRSTAGAPNLAMAFQPIVDVRDRSVFAYEALVRGSQGEPAGAVLAQVTDANRYRFDQACRVAAVEGAASLGCTSRISINFLPNAVYEPERCLQTTLAAARARAFPVDRILFEMTEVEGSRDPAHLQNIVSEYRRQGFRTAIDDFGAGHSGLNLLASFRPDYVKLDMELIRNISRDRARRTIVSHTVAMCHDLGVTPIAEGIETREEMVAVMDLGIELLQGFYFARPGFKTLPGVCPSAFAVDAVENMPRVLQ